MLYNDIENYFSSEEKIKELLELYEPVFIDIDDIDEKLSKGEIESIEELDETIGKLSGLGNKCEMVAELADTEKKREEGKREYTKIKGTSGKPNMSQISREVSHEVQFIRRVRNVFRAYVKRVDRAFSGCQSRMRKKEKSRSYQEDSE